jgi:hypothetical protein
VREIWGALSVDDHIRRRALVAEVLLFDRVVIPVPPADDDEEKQRWHDKRWDPVRQRRMLDILGDGSAEKDLAVTIPWTETKRSLFQTLNDNQRQVTPAKISERERLLTDLQIEASELVKMDSRQITRGILAWNGSPEQDEKYAQYLPRADVEAVIPAYTTFKAADEELRLKTKPDIRPDASLIGWNLFLPADSAWSDETALERAAAIARDDDYRDNRELFRDWWRLQSDRGTPSEKALNDLVGRAKKLNAFVKATNRKTRTLRSFALIGGGMGIAGVWCPPVAVAGGCIALVGVGGEWLWRTRQASSSLAPAAMFTDARKQLGWH